MSAEAYAEDMSDKETLRVTLEDLASMIERNIAHKEDIDRLENNLVRIEGKIDQLPTRNEILDLLGLRTRLEDVAQRVTRLEATAR